MSTVHRVAITGFGAGTNDHYDRARPSYPARALTALYASLSVSSSLKVAEIGSGTGLFTRALLSHSRFGRSVAELCAVEPSAGMRDAFGKVVKDSRVSCREGTFETTGLETGWADLVVVAQAWHWCADFDKGIAEIGRVLKPRGVAAFIWNIEDRSAAPWTVQLVDTYNKYQTEVAGLDFKLWRKTFQTASYKSLFHPEEETNWGYPTPVTIDRAIDRVMSRSYITVLGREEKERLRVHLEHILEAGQGKRWIDEQAGVFEYPYRTRLVIMRKK